jgi:demethylspheroidene O-methyltransferase
MGADTAAMDPNRGDWRSRWFARRNRLLAQPRFQRWASRFAPTRPIATRRAGALFDLCAGFVYSQILFACVELRLFETLEAGPLPPDAIAARCGLKPEAMARLLEAARALHLVEARGAAYGLGVHGAAYLGNPAVGAMIAHHAMLYRDLADPVALLKAEAPETELARFWPYATAADPHALGAEAVAPYSELMASSQALIADDVLEAYPFVDHACLLDIGGGDGAFLVAAAHRRPDLRIVCFDLPAVAARAEARYARERLAGRARAIGGDFKVDPLPTGADLMSLVRVAHDLDDGDLAGLLAKICQALPPGGILLLAEPLAQTTGAERVGAYFAMYLLAMRRGRPRSEDELTRALYAAGFARVRRAATSRPMLTSLLIAQKSAGPRNRAVRLD